MSALKKNRSDHAVAAENGFSRAGFLKAGGALLVGIVLPGTVATGTAVAAEIVDVPPATFGRPWASVDPGKASSWLAIHADNTVTAFSGKVELGMGNQTAITQLIAEQLDVPFEAITLIMGDTAVCVNQGITAASATIRDGGPQLSLAAAGGRQALVELASRHLGVPVAQLEVFDGNVIDRGNQKNRVSYGELVQGKLLEATFPLTKVRPPETPTITPRAAPLKPTDDLKVVGQSISRVDIPPKVMAEYEYIQDVKVPGMLHGRVIRPPALGARLVSVGEPPAGVRVVRVKDFLGVVAEKEWDAIQAARSLETSWTSWEGLPKQSETSAFLRASRSVPTVIERGGNLAAGMRSAARTLTATYETPIETHGSIGPSCAIVEIRDNTATVWAGTQGPWMVQGAVAGVLRMRPEQVRVIGYPASGCYGRNGADPAVIDATIMAQETGAPVRVQWMRWDEHGWDPKGPATVNDMQGGLDRDGNIVAFGHEAWLPAQFNVTIIGGVLSGLAAAVPGSGGWAGELNYEVPNKLLLSQSQNNMAADNNDGVGVISAWLRSPAQFQLTFAMESFIDELAHAAGEDPVRFRLRHLTGAEDSRLAAVLKGVAELARWEPGVSARNVRPGTDVVTGRGVAISLRDGTYDAEVADVEVDRSTGQITVKQVYVVEDHGLTVNPRACELGIEAGVVQSVSRTLLEQVDFSRSAITSTDWASYPILTFSQAPQVTTQIIDHPELPSTGVGEAHCCPLPAAVNNAVFDATGVRMRSMPLRPEKVKAALQAQSV
ncbi:MAG TPA: molybdopterin cofactor-binding domain-containing protein [Conexibacter sp.]|jgi:CO/xanthine dehydrogenase Mo-binding subunit